MIKKVILSALLICSVTGISAKGGIRLVELGLKAGIVSENNEIMRPTYGNYQLSTDSRVGMQLGIMSRINLAMFHIQPELLYSMNRYRLLSNTSEGVLSKATVKLNTVEVPVLVGLKLLMFRLNAGPVFNILTNSSIAKSEVPARSVIFNKPAISYMFGLGADIGKVNIDVRYNGQFARAEQSIQIGSEASKEFKTKLHTWAFTIGYMF